MGKIILSKEDEEYRKYFDKEVLGLENEQSLRNGSENKYSKNNAF